MRLGVIDCGTNTFHLLIVDVLEDGQFAQVFKKRRYVRLGQEGLDQIGSAPFNRGVACLADYKKHISSLGVDKLQVFGTEALRRAANGTEFIQAVRAKTGIEVQIISGIEEARLIHLGVMKAVPPLEGLGLIMDIGGGSVELIIADKEGVHWAQSFPIGVQVLYSKFHQTDPVPLAQQTALKEHLDQTLAPFLTQIREQEIPVLIGASGSFEVVEQWYARKVVNELSSVIPVADYQSMHEEIVDTSLPERLKMKNIPAQRAELIVVAFLLIRYVIEKAGIQKIITSAYAMKEGILMEMAQQQ